MDVRSASASLLVAVCITASACTATSPRPLPPRRVFDQTPGATMAGRPQTPPDLRQPTQVPTVHERYVHWMLLVDLPSVYPLTYWAFYPERVYYAAPSLLLPPLIHALHGEGEKALISVGLRSLMLGGVYLAGQAARSECEDEFLCFPLGSITLMNLAILPVILVDGLFLARRERPVDGWHRLPVVPSVSSSPYGGKSLVLSGQF